MDCWLYNNCNHKDCNKSFCLRKYKLDTLYTNSLLSESQRTKISLFVDSDQSDLEAFKRLSEISNNIETFVNNGKNLYIHSSQCGNGKTSWAIRLIQNYFDKVWSKADTECKALFISVPRFLLAIKDNISEKNEYVAFIKEHIMGADLVIWDDIAAKVGSEFELNHLLSFIDGRIALGKSNIYTSNLNKQQMFTALGERLTSRVANYSEEIEFIGGDKRNINQGDNK